MVKGQFVQCCKLPEVLVLMDLCCQMLHTGLCIALPILLE